MPAVSVIVDNLWSRYFYLPSAPSDGPSELDSR